MDSLRWRRHRGLLGLIVVVLLVLVVVLGDIRIAAITSSERNTTGSGVTHDIAGQVDLFDDSVTHEISLTFEQHEYDAMIAAYQEEGEKVFIEGRATIDGTTIPSVGLRLKGNSTLMSLRRDGPFGPGRGGPGNMRPPSECIPPEMAAAFAQAEATPPAGATPIASPGPDGPSGPGIFPPEGDEPFEPGRNPFGGNISADDPASLPWLISFDEINEGQRYQGLSDIAMRPVLANKAMLNEALSLNLVGIAGEPTQRAAYSSFSVNGSNTALRLILEVPGDAYAARNFATQGVLYKSLSTGSFDYLGDDPTAYEAAFDQETARNHQDLRPLIGLLKWTSTASDEAFAAQLDQHVAVTSLARYTALQEMLDNFDDMAGPGKNYYLWYDLETEKFTVLAWDLNLAMAEMGMPGGPGSRGPFGDMSFDFNAMMSCVERVMGPDAFGSIRAPRMGHPLKDRFLAAPKFQALYAREYQPVYDAFFSNDRAMAELDRLAAVVRASGLIEAATLETEVDAVRSRLRAQEALGPAPVQEVPSGTPTVATPVAATPFSQE